MTSPNSYQNTAAAVRPLLPREQPGLRLLCFPHAGSGPSIFRGWPALLDPSIEVVGVAYPGRETRSHEKPVTCLNELLELLLPEIVAQLDGPFALFGHSMGGLLCFEVARALLQRHGMRAEQVFVSAAGAPHVAEPNPIHHLGDVDFLRSLVRLNGMPPEVLRSPDMLKYVLPILRADFTVCETYRYQVGAPLLSPLTVFGGDQDQRVAPARLAAWRDHAGTAFDLRMFSGDHFFLRAQQRGLLHTINRDLRQLIAAVEYV